MYYIRLERAEELKDGRTFAAISDILGNTIRFLSSVFKGGKCKKMLAMSLINIKHKTPFNSIEMEEMLNYYFIQK